MDLDQLRRRSAGARWDFSSVDKLMSEAEGRPRALCVLGGAGTGKSTVSAALLREGFFEEPTGTTSGESCPSGVVAAAAGVASGGMASGGMASRVGRRAAVAYHFLKHNDERRLDPVRMAKSLAFQLARQLPEYRAALLALDGQVVDKLTKVNDACAMLLNPLMRVRGPVAILVDALDEADPAVEQETGFDPTKHPVIPAGNRALRLITAFFAKLPPNFRFFFTARPETARGELKAILARAFGASAHYVGPHEVLVGQEAEEGKVMVHDIVVAECGLHGELPSPAAAPGLHNLYDAYLALFERGSPIGGHRVELLEVLLAAREPLTLALLQAMGLEPHLTALPGWGTLFYAAEHRVYFLHKSLSDWLRMARRKPDGSYAWGVGGAGEGMESAGNYRLGIHLASADILGWKSSERCAMKYADRLGAHLARAEFLAQNNGQRSASDYAAKYAVLHLCAALAYVAPVAAAACSSVAAFTSATSSTYVATATTFTATIASPSAATVMSPLVTGADSSAPTVGQNAPIMEAAAISHPQSRGALGLLVDVLGFWPFLKQSLGAGHGATMVRALGTLDIAGTTDDPCRTYARDALCWLRRFLNDFEARPEDMERTTLLNAPTSSPKYKEAVRNANAVPCQEVYGSEDNSQTWHPDNAVIKWPGSMLGVAFSPFGNWLATCGDVVGDARVVVWDIKDGHMVTTLELEDAASVFAEVFEVAYSPPDGRYIAACGRNGIACVWDVASGQLIHKLVQQAEGVYAHNVPGLAFSFDGKILATASDDSCVRLWNIETGLLKTELLGHSSIVACASFSTDNSVLATGSFDKTVRIWDLQSGNVTVLEHPDRVRCLAFSPDGTVLATGSLDAESTITLWNAGSLTKVRTLHGKCAGIQSMAFSCDQKWLATGSVDHTAILWDAASWLPTATLRVHSAFVHSIAFSPDGKWLATGSYDKTVHLANMTQLTASNAVQVKENAGSVKCVALSKYGNTIATVSYDWNVKIWTASTGILRATLAHTEAVNFVDFSPNGLILAVSTCCSSLRFWDIERGKVCLAVDVGDCSANTIAFSPNGRTFATIARTMRLWNYESGELIGTLCSDSKDAQCVAFRADGDLIACGTKSKTISLFNVHGEGLRKIATLKCPIGCVTSMAFSSYGSQLASCMNAASVQIWDLTSYNVIATITPIAGWSSGFVFNIAFNGDGSLILAGIASEAVAFLWNVSSESGRLIHGHKSRLREVLIARDCSYMAAVSTDRTARSWDLKQIELKSRDEIGIGFLSSSLPSENGVEAEEEVICDFGSVVVWPDGSARFQSGRIRIKPCSSLEIARLPPALVINVKFSAPFESVPSIFVGLANIALEGNLCLEVEAVDATKCGFVLIISLAQGSIWHAIDVTWVASLDDQIISGTTPEIRERIFKVPVFFDKELDKVPQICTAISMVDAVSDVFPINVRVTSRVENVSKQGFDIVGETWHDSITHALKLNWCVFSDAEIFVSRSIRIGKEFSCAITESSPQCVDTKLPEQVGGAQNLAFIGITHLEILTGRNLCVNVEAEIIEDGSCIRTVAMSGYGAKNWSVGVAVLAVSAI